MVTTSSDARTGRSAADRPLVGIGAAAQHAGVSERALRYYQQLGLINPACTSGGLRRYAEHDLARVARIRELQTLLGLNLDEIAAVLRDEDRVAEIKVAYHDERTDAAARKSLVRESLAIHENLRAEVEAKRVALDSFLGDLDRRIDLIRNSLDSD
ncbi:MAG TPA: MerR family transcriptional regulator [Pseudonocardiaceae bacterium]|nr:MerR family transcriptional regulator [Pseudonocardiaceae bacterium]